VIGGGVTTLALPRSGPYLKAMAQGTSVRQETISTRPSSRAGSVIAWSAAGFGGLILLGAAALWMHYGTAVFFEMIAAGISACF
jgi:hypothetical protein